MDVDVILSAESARKHLISLVKSCDSLSWVSAWATPNPVLDAAMAEPTKIHHLVVGTHRYVTSPEVLEECRKLAVFRVVLPTATKLFHPKVYAFKRDGRIEVFVGSSNLTAGGMKKNIEAGVLMRGDASDEVLLSLFGYVIDCWSKADSVTDEFLYAYRANHRRAKIIAAAIDEWVPVKKPTGTLRQVPPQDLTWIEFLRLVQSEEAYAFKTRLKVLSETRRLFGPGTRFVDLPIDDRRCVAGTAPPSLIKGRKLDWGYFGGMRNNGVFTNAITGAPGRISKALDEIPLDVPVSRDHYQKFVERFIHAYGEPSYKRLGTGTRLLAMKRPDYFVCVNRPNKQGICQKFGVAPTTLDLRGYWDGIIAPMMLTPWWLAKRPPDSLGRKVWMGRAAMLDAIYYDESKR